MRSTTSIRHTLTGLCLSIGMASVSVAVAGCSSDAPARAFTPQKVSPRLDAAGALETCVGVAEKVGPKIKYVSKKASEALEKAGTWCKRGQAAEHVWDDYQQCLRSGASTGLCRGLGAAKLGLCMYAIGFSSPYAKILPSGIDPFTGLFAAVAKDCLGEPPLKCCRSNAGGYCWSAFNAPRPINCEGNPYYGPTHTAGLCLRPPSGLGCLCQHIPECAIGGGALSADPAAVNDRRNTAFTALQNGFLGQAGAGDGSVDGAFGATDSSGYSATGDWNYAFGGRRGTYRWSPKGDGAKKATWTVQVPTPGDYDVQVTWPECRRGCATDATFTVADGDKLLATVTLDQTKNPTGTNIDGVVFQSLGTFGIASGAVKITLSNKANGDVRADSVRVVGNGLRSDDPALRRALLDFATFRGCKGWRDASLETDPFEDPSKLAGGYKSLDYDANLVRNLATRAAMRVLYAVPNGLARLDYVHGRRWTDAETAAYLTKVADPDAELAKWMGPLALRILRAADPQYRLLAVPLDEEATPEAGSQFDGCIAGSAPTVDVSIAQAVGGPSPQASVELQVNVDDPEWDPADPNGGGNAAGLDSLVIDWGDGQVEPGYAYVLAEPTNNVFRHTYAAAGSYAVRAYVVNGAGLSASADATAVVASSGGGAPNVSALVVSLVMQARATTIFHDPIELTIDAVDAAGQSEQLAHRTVLFPPSDVTPLFADLGELRLSRLSRAPIKSLRLRPRLLNVAYPWTRRELLLVGASIDLNGAPDDDPTIRPLRIDATTTKVYLGTATTPVAPDIDPTTEALVLPGDAREIVIDVVPAGG